MICFCSLGFAEKIISLAPNLTELVCYLGGAPQLAGITGDCTYPQQIQKLPKVGKYQFPSVEGIIALQPATVIAEDTVDTRFLNKLKNLHIAYKLYHVQQLNDIISGGKQLAKDFSLDAKPLQLLQKKLHKPLPKNMQPAFIILWQQPLIAAGQNTFIAEYWQHRGYRNLTPATGYPLLSKELLMAHPEATVINLSGQPWKDEHKKIENLNLDIYLRLGPRLIETL